LGYQVCGQVFLLNDTGMHSVVVDLSEDRMTLSNVSTGAVMISG
jgi:hypothetical protein